VLDATLNGLRTVEVPCTLKENEDDVAFTPATVALSRRVPVDKVDVPMNLVMNPFIPPDTVPDGLPQIVLVPVD